MSVRMLRAGAVEMRVGILSVAAAEHGVHPSRARHWSREPGFPAPIDTNFRPYKYDLDAVAEWVRKRPGQGARTDLQTEGGK